MNTEHGTNETDGGRHGANGGTIWISAAIFSACFALYIAEEHGFRIFEENVSSMQMADNAVPSPLEVLTLLGTTSVGVCAGLVLLIAIIGRCIQRLRNAHEAVEARYAESAAEGAVQHVAS